MTAVRQCDNPETEHPGFPCAHPVPVGGANLADVATVYQTTLTGALAARPTLTWETWPECAAYLQVMTDNGHTVSVTRQ